MDEHDFNLEIRHAWSLVRDTLKIAHSIVWDRSLRVDEQFRDVALDEESSYEEIFTTGLSRSAYNILLSDYAYLQFSWQNETSWRLGYFPNPWLSGVAGAQIKQAELEALEETGELSHEDVSMLLSEMPYHAAVPPIRFEYAVDQYKEIVHPAAHFHIGRHTQNRWSSAVAIGPLTFTLQISKMYYPQSWGLCSNFAGANVVDCIEQRLMGSLHAVRQVHEFSAREREALHFGRNI